MRNTVSVENRVTGVWSNLIVRDGQLGARQVYRIGRPETGRMRLNGPNGPNVFFDDDGQMSVDTTEYAGWTR